MLNNFEKEILKFLLKIPEGRISTYKIFAGHFKTTPRLIGKILAKNPFLQKYPCYKIIKSNGEIGGYSGGAKEKIALLRKEGIEISENRIVDFEKRLFKF